MNSEEIAVELEKRGWKVVDLAVNQSGRMVKLIEDRAGRSLAMFQHDTEDFVRGRATIEQIVERNKGADLADPWPEKIA